MAKKTDLGVKLFLGRQKTDVIKVHFEGQMLNSKVKLDNFG